jgi:hypothetical protein
MSTKTTFKRVALVAVAALGLGVLSVAPSQAASQADSLTLSSATASQLTGETLTATSATTTLSFLGGNVGDTMSVSAFLTSAPAGNTVLPTLVLGDTTSALVGSSAQVTNLDAKAKVGQVAYVAAAASTKAVSAKFLTQLEKQLMLNHSQQLSQVLEHSETVRTLLPLGLSLAQMQLAAR